MRSFPTIVGFRETFDAFEEQSPRFRERELATLSSRNDHEVEARRQVGSLEPKRLAKAALDPVARDGVAAAPADGQSEARGLAWARERADREAARASPPAALEHGFELSTPAQSDGLREREARRTRARRDGAIGFMGIHGRIIADRKGNGIGLSRRRPEARPVRSFEQETIR